MLHRFLGIEVAPGEASRARPAFSKDNLIFEWTLGGADGSSRAERVAVFCKSALQSGVPLPNFAHRISTAQLEGFGRDAAQAGTASLGKKLGVNDLAVDCAYLGVSTASGPPDLHVQPAHNSSLVYATL